MKNLLYLLIIALISIGCIGCNGDATDDGGDTIFYTMTFTAEGVGDETFLTDSMNGFSDYTTYWASRWHRAGETDNYCFIDLPSDVTTTTYDKDNLVDNFSFRYTTPAPDNVTYSVTAAGDFSLTVTRWDGSGGIVTGDFSGTLYDSGSNPIIITNGEFISSIQ